MSAGGQDRVSMDRGEYNRLQAKVRDQKSMKWISVEDRLPDHKEPVVYMRRKSGRKGWFVGIAYWTVSKKWNPEMESTQAPDGITHWTPLPEPPEDK